MATRAQEQDDLSEDGKVQAGHDQWVKAKVMEGVAQSRDRASLQPIEQVWRDLLP